MSNYNTLGISRITKIVKDAAGVGAKRVVAYGDDPNTVENTAGANAGNLAGITWDGAADGGAVSVAEYGYPEIECAGNVAYGQEVNVADNRGRIKAVNETGTTVVLVGVAEEAGTAGKRIKVNVRKFGQTKTV